MSNLGRINLLVGTNNSGKTSILEAIEILASKGDIAILWQNLWRRGERIYVAVPAGGEPARQRLHVEADVCHLFNGHEIHPGTGFSITAQNESPVRTITCEISEISPSERAEVSANQQGPSSSLGLALNLSGNPTPKVPRIVLGQFGGIPSESLEPSRRGNRDTESAATYFVTTESLSGDQLLALWNRISLKPEEDLVLQALQFVDKDIERIAPIPNTVQPYYFGPGMKGGFMVKRKSAEQPVPIGSMGDGVWRMLALSIAIILCKGGGTLLIDEIDTGLHYTVMSAMWKLIYNAARQFNVQVFATSHSQDCIWSLAQIAEHADDANPITVQRIEPARLRSIPFSGRELALAAEREIEVR